MKILSFITILLFATTIYGQKDQAAESYLNKISSDFSVDQAVHLLFNYVREDLQAETKFEGSGSLVIQEDKYKIELDEALIYFDGEKQYSLNKEIEEVYISIPDHESQEFVFSDPLRLLRNYKEKFKYRLMGESSIGSINSQEVQLYPEELGGPYALLKIHFSRDTDQLKAIVIRQKDGIIYTMIINEMEKKDTQDLKYFQFNASEFPNVDVIELMD
jgi:hypothetical protein